MNQTPFGFTGEPKDGNGLVYLRARHYNPTLGQFISLDPLELGNRYQYVKSNPVQLTDPSGLENELCEKTLEEIFEQGFELLEDGELPPEVSRQLAKGVCNTVEVVKQ